MNISKEEAINRIYNMQNKLNRPLMYDDFRNPNNETIGVTTIKKYWGTINKMKQELNIVVNQENMLELSKTPSELLKELNDFIKELGRLPTAKEIDNNKKLSSQSYYFRNFGGINQAYIQLGYKPNKKVIALGLSNEEIKQSYIDIIEDLGFVPTQSYFDNIYNLTSPLTVTRRFKCTWKEFIKDVLGYEPIINTKIKSSIVKAKDGTKCLSVSESIIHNFLLDNFNEIIIKKEVLYRDFIKNEDLKQLCGFKRCDWLVSYNNKDYIIEFFGLDNIPEYKKRMSEKINLITQDNQLNNFIPIYPSQIHKLNEIILI